jgi:hypothetical protein
VSRPHFSPNNIDAPETGKKLTLTRGISAASGINGWVNDGVVKDQAEGRDEAATYEGKLLSNAGVDLSLTMAGGLPPIHSAVPVASEGFNGGMGRDLMIAQPTGSEVGDRATSYESRGPSSRKRNLEEGGSTADKPQDGVQHADSIEGTVIDRDGEEVDDDVQDSDIQNKRSRGFNFFDANLPSCSGAGPSRNLCIDSDVDTSIFGHSRAVGLGPVEHPSARDSMRASSVIAMNIIHGAEENSMDSVQYQPCDGDDVEKPSSTLRSGGMSDTLDLNYSNQAQESIFVQPAADSNARDIGASSMNGGEEVLNADTAPILARDQLSLGVSGGSVGMGASHEAEIHGVEVSEHKTESVVGDVEPVPELIETMGQTGESAPGPGMMDEFVPEDVGREEPQGDSHDVVSRLVGQVDSGSTKADSVESGEKMSHARGQESNLQHSLSCNARVYSGIDLSKDEVTQTGKMLTKDEYDPGNDLGTSAS